MKGAFSSLLTFREFSVIDLGQFVYEVLLQFALYLELITFGISFI